MTVAEVTVFDFTLFELLCVKLLASVLKKYSEKMKLYAKGLQTEAGIVLPQDQSRNPQPQH